MPDGLPDHIRRYVPLDADEQEILLSLLKHRSVKKKEYLLKEGQICTANYFIIKGVLRLYLINEKGAGQITQFGIDNWWLSDYTSLERHTPSGFYIQAVENTEIASLEKEHEKELFGKLPQLETYFRIIYQRAYAASQIRIRYIFSQSGEERYHHFNNLYPEFVQRIPQYMLASFLGFTPEFLSKTRAKANKTSEKKK